MATTTLELVGKAKAFPPSKYAINTQSGLVFFEVSSWKRKAEGVEVRYLKRLVGHPGTWLKVKFNPKQEAWILGQLEAQGPKALAKLYALEHKCCAKCGSPLSDPLSLERGIGPDCWKSF